MKTLNELRLQAENMFFSKMQDPCSPLADLASRLLFRAGWSAAVEELTRWRDPKEKLPEAMKPILVKYGIRRDISVMRLEFTADKRRIWAVNNTNYFVLDREILGWRPIIELPDDGEKEG